MKVSVIRRAITPFPGGITEKDYYLSRVQKWYIQRKIKLLLEQGEGNILSISTIGDYAD